MAKRHRAYWKGYLRLSLVTIAVEVYNAVESKSDISFRQIHKPTGRRVHYQKVVQGVGEIENSDIVKGYEVDTDTYVTIEPEEIDALKLESKKTIDLVQFVDAAELDYRYFERPYFVAPADPLAGEGFVVIRDSLRKTGKVGLAQVTIGGREWLVAIAPVEDGLIMEMLRYADELREPKDFFEEVPREKPQKAMIDLAVQLIEQKSAPFKPEAFTDRYQDALKSLVQMKMKGKKVVAPEEEGRPSGANVIDLMEALKKSVQQSPAKTGRSPKASSVKQTKGPSSSSGRSKKKA
ncbi:MAG: Ku protein [Alphaproteobacteria bacterium]|nr:Ku protein [Alphaproteobacteria bacterium]